MSDLTQVKNGTMSVPQFIAKEVAAFTSNPFMKALAPIILDLYAPQLEKMLGVSSTTAYVIVSAIEGALAGEPIPAALSASAPGV